MKRLKTNDDNDDGRRGERKYLMQRKTIIV